MRGALARCAAACGDACRTRRRGFRARAIGDEYLAYGLDRQRAQPIAKGLQQAAALVALVDGVPRTLDLQQCLFHYIEHQAEVITRRSEFRLAKHQARAHIVEGLIRALDMIDQIIEVIRASADKAAASEALQATPFEFSEIQAEHILDMRLHRLTQLGRADLEDVFLEIMQGGRA